PARHFALRSLDRILAEAWQPDRGLNHVIAYSDPSAARRDVPGLLDDYAFTVIACLDAYQTTADLSYFNFARRIADAMIERFYDPVGGGFFDVERARSAGGELGALAAARKPFQDSPTPAGNSAAAIALLRLHSYTNDPGYREKAEDTLEVFAGIAPQYGIFAGTYAIAAVMFSSPHVQVVVVGDGEEAERLGAAAIAPFALNKAVLCLPENEAIAQNLPPALAETIPNVPGLKEGKTVAVVCSNFTCRPPIANAEELARTLRDLISGK
ncbi:MAG TPA: thioredoxin domain-containing protein, partial [Terriglobales bacterium]|nr:thioredoxin domain-containing protein [Terriglobales bacterium]